jgi:opacity protein-like surface antigen
MKRFCCSLAKKGCAFVLLTMLAQKATAQYYYYNDKYYDNAYIIEIGGGIGGINCLTDIGGNKGVGKKFIKDINWKNTQLCTNVYGGVFIKDIFGIRLEGTFGKVKAYDSILSKYKDDNATKGRYYRNLNFRSNISEFAIIAEFHPLMLQDFVDKEPPLFSPYILAGIGRFNFNPQTYYQGQWIDVRPLRLEGQGFAEYKDRTMYHISATSFPVGLGVRYEVNEGLVARLELSHRFTSTDYLDDVSKGAYVDPALFSNYLSGNDAFLATQLYNRHAELDPNYVPVTGDIRGKSKNNDSYFTFNLKVGITLGRKSR